MQNRPVLDKAAAAFRDAMYASVIGDNFVLRGHSYTLPDATFSEVAAHRASFRRQVKLAVRDLCGTVIPRAEHQIRNTYVESFESGLVGSYALALWFFRFDEDNWFPFDKVQKETQAYLGARQTMDERLELRLFKGFDNRLLGVEGVVVQDLPVVLDFAEKTLTLWTCGLND